jgi:hypothetical protein
MYLEKSSSYAYEAPLFVVFSNFLSIHPSSVQIFSSELCSLLYKIKFIDENYTIHASKTYCKRALLACEKNKTNEFLKQFKLSEKFRL